MIDLFMAGVRRRNVSFRVRTRCQWVLLSYCYNPGYYPADAGNGKGKEGKREQIERQSRLFGSTATTWPIRSPKVSSTLTDLSTKDRLGQSFTFTSSENFRIPMEFVGSAYAGLHIFQVNRKIAVRSQDRGSQLVQILDG